MIYKTDEELNYGVMAAITMGLTKMDRNMEMEFIIGQMDQNM